MRPGLAPSSEAAPSAPAFIPLTVSWNLTQRCNLSCAHCYIEATGAGGEDELSPDEARRLLKDVAEVNSEAVLILTGGEPLLRRDLFDLIAEASSIGFWTVLGSHGGLLDAKVADKLIASGLKGAGVSLDSVDPGRHDRFRGIPRAWEKTVSAMTVMREKGLEFLVEMTMTRENRGELAAMAEFAAEKGAAALNVFFLVPTGRGAGVNGLDAGEYEDSLWELAALQKKFAGRLLINAKCAPHYRRVLWELDSASPFVRTFRGGGCPAGTYYCRINPRGDLTPCPYMPLAVGNVREVSFKTLWSDSEILRQFRQAPRGGRCGSCEFDQLCGGCRCRAYAVTGDFLAEDPSCVYQPGKYGGTRVIMGEDKTYGASSGAADLAWTPEAEERLKAVPFFARGMVRRSVEKAARERGLAAVTAPFMQELRAKMAERFPSLAKKDA